MTIKINNKLLDNLYDEMDGDTRGRLDSAIATIVKIKKGNGKVAVVTGSGPNIHEGVTTLIAELITQDVVDGVLTSSAVIAHELAGSLDKVKRVPGDTLGYSLQEPLSWASPGKKKYFLPRGELYEFTQMEREDLDKISEDFEIDRDLMSKVDEIDGKVIIKAAGNMAYPMGPRTELLAETLLKTCQEKNEPLEATGGKGADPMTMIGAASRKGIPVMVSIPQMIGGGNVGVCIGDSISIRERSTRNARLLADAGVIIESALALAQEIHDGPFETYTGHGIWASHLNESTYTLKDKHLIRIDLDPHLKEVWEKERAGGDVQAAINDGKPKTKLFKVPFRMEMSGFARLENSNPIVGDIGVIWPLITRGIAEELGLSLNFISYPQGTGDGQSMRESIVKNVKHFDFDAFKENS
ncbi:MAG: hypothetical protein ACFFCS_01265 [Candidatus Hodarchaeota archaeon]